MNTYATLSYRELQKLCKAHGLTCKGKADELRARLIAVEQQQQQQGQCPTQERGEGSGNNDKKTIANGKAQRKSKDDEVDVSVDMPDLIDRPSNAVTWEVELEQGPERFVGRKRQFPTEDSQAGDSDKSSNSSMDAQGDADSTSEQCEPAMVSTQERSETVPHASEKSQTSGIPATEREPLLKSSTTRATKIHGTSRLTTSKGTLTTREQTSSNVGSKKVRRRGDRACLLFLHPTPSSDPVGNELICSTFFTRFLFPQQAPVSASRPLGLCTSINRLGSCEERHLLSSAKMAPNKPALKISGCALLSTSEQAKSRPKITYKPHTGRLPPYQGKVNLFLVFSMGPELNRHLLMKHTLMYSFKYKSFTETRCIPLFSPYPVMPSRKPGVPKNQRRPTPLPDNSAKHGCDMASKKKNM